MEDVTKYECKLRSSKSGEVVTRLLDTRGARIGVSFELFRDGVFWDVIEVGETARA